MKKCLSLLLLAALARAAFAAPVPVAEGFIDWTGLSDRNYLYGRTIGPSDLRQWTVVYVVVDAEAFPGQVRALSSLAGLLPVPAAHATQWETAELPHNGIVVFSVRNAKDTTPKSFATAFRPPKDAESDVARQYATYGMNMVPFYRNAAPVGEAALSVDKLPYVAVYGASGTEPLYVKENYAEASFKEVRAAVAKAQKLLPEDWTPPLGIREPQFYKNVQALLAKGKPAPAALKLLLAGIKSKNPDQAKEAQIMYDALSQHASALKLRIGLEYHAAPARAYYDYQTLVKLFPAEKKKMQAIDQALKQNKEIGALGKIFEKLMVWGRDDFVCKSPGEAKKIVAELQKFKKALETLATSSNAQIQGEAMLFAAQLDALIEIIPTKVPQK